MDSVKAFNSELSALYEVKPPISKAKMTTITRGAIKAIKFYKHVVQSVEKFIQKCKPEYKVPGLYVIDSIVRQSRHQFGPEKDVFAPRFAKNLQSTFINLFKCPPEDKTKVVRVLNLWQKNCVFQTEVIQPLFDLADPNHPIHKEQLQTSASTNGSIGGLNNLNNVGKTPPPQTKTPNRTSSNANKSSVDGSNIGWVSQIDAASNSLLQITSQVVEATIASGNQASGNYDPSVLRQIQQLQLLLLQQRNETGTQDSDQVKFDKKLLDFDYGSEDDDDHGQQQSTGLKETHLQQLQQQQHHHHHHHHHHPHHQQQSQPPPPPPPPSSQTVSAQQSTSLESLLSNPEVLRQLQTIQQHMSQQQEMEDKLRKLQEMKQQEEEFDKHLAQTVPSLPFASECELRPSGDLKQLSTKPALYDKLEMEQHKPAYTYPVLDVSQPPPGYVPESNTTISEHQSSPLEDGEQADSEVEFVDRTIRSGSPSVNAKAYRRRHSRSRSREHRHGRLSRSGSSDNTPRSHSRSRKRRSRSRERERERDRERDREKEREREKEKERKKKGLPPIKKEHLSVCSTTLWVGHLSKLVHDEELSDTFGEYGDIVSIDLIPPRGCAFICMNRRQDAYKALQKLKSFKLQGKAITLAWAPGRGMKGKEWKDYWEKDLGVSYIPWEKLSRETDLDGLEEGGMIDEETVPEFMKAQTQHQHTNQSSSNIGTSGTSAPTKSGTETNSAPPSFIPLPEGIPVPTSVQQRVDTSQPPPIRANEIPMPTPSIPGISGPIPTGVPPPSGAMTMVPPFGIPNVPPPIGMAMGHGMMPNVPIGVPPPGMQGLLMPGGQMMHQQMMGGVPQPVNSPFNTSGLLAGHAHGQLSQIPLPAPAAPQDKPNTGLPHTAPPVGVPPPTSEANLPGLNEALMRVPFGLPPQLQQPPPGVPMHRLNHEDIVNMDVQMEDADSKLSNGVPSDQSHRLTDQILAALGHGFPAYGHGNSGHAVPQGPPPSLLPHLQQATQTSHPSEQNRRNSKEDISKDGPAEYSGGRNRDRNRDRDRDRDRHRDRGDRDRERERGDRDRDRGRDRDRNSRWSERDRERDRDRDKERDRRDRDRDRDKDWKESQNHSEDRENCSVQWPDKGEKPSLLERLRNLANDGHSTPNKDERHSSFNRERENKPTQDRSSTERDRDRNRDRDRDRDRERNRDNHRDRTHDRDGNSAPPSLLEMPKITPPGVTETPSHPTPDGSRLSPSPGPRFAGPRLGTPFQNNRTGSDYHAPGPEGFRPMGPMGFRPPGPFGPRGIPDPMLMSPGHERDAFDPRGPPREIFEGRQHSENFMLNRDDFDCRRPHGEEFGPRGPPHPDDFDISLHPDDFEHGPARDGFDLRGPHMDEFDPRAPYPIGPRPDIFPPRGPEMFGPRGMLIPRGPMRPDGFGPRPMMVRGPGPMFHPRGPPGPMGMRGMGPGPRPGIWMDGQGPPIFPRGFEGPPGEVPPEAFFGRPPFDEMDRRSREDGRHLRWGPRRGPPGSRDGMSSRDVRRREEEDGQSASPVKRAKTEDSPSKGESKSSKPDRDRNRKSRWSSASPQADAVAISEPSADENCTEQAESKVEAESTKFSCEFNDHITNGNNISEDKFVALESVEIADPSNISATEIPQSNLESKEPDSEVPDKETEVPLEINENLVASDA